MLLVVWWGVAALYWVSPLFLPAPQQVLHQLIIIASPHECHPVATSGGQPGTHGGSDHRHSGGFCHGLNDTVRGILVPLIEIYLPVPPLAYLPLMVIWFGIGETSKILLISLAIFTPVTLSAMAGVRSVARVRVRAAHTLEDNRWQVLYFVVLPSALPEMLTGIRIGLGVSWSTWWLPN